MSDDVRGLLDFVYRSENGGKVDYNVVYSGIAAQHRPKKPLTTMTVEEVLNWQNSIDRMYNSEAAGAPQVMEDTLRGLVGKGVVAKDQVFNEETQDQISVALMREKGLDDWQAGKISTEKFGTGLAKVWASLPVLQNTYRNGRPIPRGSAYYGGVGANKGRSAYTAVGFETVLGDPGRELVSHASYRNTGIAGTQVAESAYGGSLNEWMAQFGPSVSGDPYRHADAWRNSELQRDGRDNLSVSSEVYDLFPGLETRPDYRTRTGPGSTGPVLHPGAGQAFRDEFTDAYIVRATQAYNDQRGQQFDLTFDPFEQAVADGYSNQIDFLGRARNADHYQYLKQRVWQEEQRNKRRAVNEHQLASFMGAMASPDVMLSMAVPGGIIASATRRGTTNAIRSGLSAGAISGALEAGFEHGRAPLDPFSTKLDSQIRVGGALVLGGFLGGAIGAQVGKSLRKGLADDLVREIAYTHGVGTTTGKVDLGSGRVGTVALRRKTSDGAASAAAGNRGVTIVGDEVFVDDAVITARFKAGNHGTGARTPTELAEYEISYAASLVRKARNLPDTLRGFAADEVGSWRTSGKSEPLASIKKRGDAPVVDKAELARRLKRGDRIAVGPAKGSIKDGKLKPLMMKAEAFRDVDDAAEVVRIGAEAAEKARTQGEFRELVEKGLQERKEKVLGKPRITNKTADDAKLEKEAHAEAGASLEKWRKKNNKILADARIQAMARIMDGPYKRTHRNALTGEARDLMDVLAADGGFLRASDGSGVTIGPSVYSRAHTWDGVVRRVWDHERRLYARYKGFDENPEILPDITLSDLHSVVSRKRGNGDEVMDIHEWRDTVTKTLITDVRHDVPEVNEMVSHLKAAFREYETAASELGVITPRKTMSQKIKEAKERLKSTKEGTAEWADLTGDIQQMEIELDSFGELPTDYFTRVWNKRSIVENREYFRDHVVMPWMRHNPNIQVWEEGKDVLRQQYRSLKANGGSKAALDELAERAKNAPERGYFKKIKASMEPAAVRKRADKIIETVLEEADPDELSIFREGHRPTFGRHRQFDIPNDRLLASGPMGNKIADFIETDYNLVLKIYNDRMAPSIEMARSFASPKNGVGWLDGFHMRLDDIKEAEKKAWWKKNKKMDGFNAHWDRLEVDYLHMKDRVTNRVFRNPDRWDNRAATNMRNWSHMAFMGMSGLPVVQEIGTLVMRHGLKNVYRHAFNELDEVMKQVRKAGIEEMRLAGGIMETMNGTALARFAETGMDSVQASKVERWAKYGAHKMFLFNGVSSLSTRLKEIDAAMRVHRTSDIIMKVVDGTHTPDEMAELNRFGISANDAHRMAKMPMERTPDGHWLPNTEAWADEDLVRKFRAAIRQGNENTILMATAADKPVIMDGTVYLRKGGAVDEYALKLGLESQGNFWKVQSGMMTLPFTFWNYAVAATNKIMLAGLDEPSVRVLQGIGGLVALGWMVEAARSSDWDSRSFDQKMVGAIEQSGVVGLVGQYANFLDGSFIAATGQGGNRLDGAFRAAGAGPSVVRNAVEGTLTADPSRLSWALPYRNFWLWNSLIDAAVDGMERVETGTAQQRRAN